MTPGTRPNFNQLIPKALRVELERTALLARIQESTDVPLVCLIAPSGYGKTIVLAQHARQSDRRVVWLTLCEDDAEPHSLAESLRRALKRAQPELELEPFTVEAPPHILAGALAHGLDRATQNLEIILDESDHLSPDSGRWLERFLRELGEGHRVLLAGRTEAPIGLARLVARGQAIILGADRLAFDPGETRAYLERNGFSGDPRSIHEALEGWAAGLALVAGGASPHVSPGHLILEVLESLEPALYDNISEAAVLEVWTERAARELGCDLPDGWLEAARRSGLPLTPLGQDAFRPHRLVLDTLETELQRRPARHALLHARAAERAMGDGDPLRALRHHLQAGREDRALEIALGLVPRFEARSEYRLVRQVLEPFRAALPTRLQRSLGHALVQTGEPERGEALLRTLLEDPNPIPEVYHSLCLLANRQGQHAEQLELAGLGLQHASTPSERLPLMRLQSTALWGLGRYQEALERALEAVQLAELHVLPVQLGLAWLHVADARHELGQRQESSQALHLAFNTLDALAVPVQVLPLLNDLANDHLLAGRSDEALELLDHAIPIAEQESSVMLPILLETQGECRVWRGEFETARAALTRALEVGFNFKLAALCARCHAKLAECELRLGQPERAAEHLGLVHGLEPHPSTQASIAFAEGLLCLHHREPDLARRHLESIESPVVDQQLEPRARAYLCLIAERQAQLTREHLDSLVDCLDRFGTDEVLRVDATALEPVFEHARTRGWHAERLGRLRSAPAVGTSTGKAMLELTTLGTLQARLNNQVVHLPFAKAGELLVWLVLHGPASRERIVDALWEGSNEQRHVEYFKVAVRRLRNALSDALGAAFNPLPFEAGVYRLAEQLEVRLDLHEVLRALQAASPALETTLRSQPGPFLPEADAEWVRYARDQFTQQALEAALRLSDAVAAQQPDLAERALEFALRVDPNSEEAYLKRIELHLAQQDLNAAQRAYRELSRMLKDTFDAAPPAALTARFESYRASRQGLENKPRT